MCQCRICLDEVPEGERHQYCDCIGSNGDVHFECLEKWILGNNFKDTCEICNSKYRLNYIPQYPVIINLDFMFLLLLMIGSIVGCVIGWISLKDNTEVLYVNIKNTLLYLPFIFSHGLRIKYIKTKKILSYKLVFNGVDENTALIENGTINDNGSINLSSDLDEDAQPLID
jgi:hypothetical protein